MINRMIISISIDLEMSLIQYQYKNRLGNCRNVGNDAQNCMNFQTIGEDVLGPKNKRYVILTEVF